MNHLKIVRDEPPKPRLKRQRSPLLTPDEEKRFRQAMKNLRDAFGTWACLAAAMGAALTSLDHMRNGASHVSGDMVVRAMRASGLTLTELLGAPVLAGTCRACGAVRRAS